MGYVYFVYVRRCCMGGFYGCNVFRIFLMWALCLANTCFLGYRHVFPSVCGFRGGGVSDGDI